MFDERFHFSGDSPSRRSLLLVPAVLESRNQDYPTHIQTNHSHSGSLHFLYIWWLFAEVNEKGLNASVTINLISFASLFPFGSLGPRGADRADVSLTDRTYSLTLRENQSMILAIGAKLARRFQNKTLVTLNGVLWTGIKEVTSDEALIPTQLMRENLNCVWTADPGGPSLNKQEYPEQLINNAARE